MERRRRWRRRRADNSSHPGMRGQHPGNAHHKKIHQARIELATFTACEADVIATRPLVPMLAASGLTGVLLCWDLGSRALLPFPCGTSGSGRRCPVHQASRRFAFCSVSWSGFLGATAYNIIMMILWVLIVKCTARGITKEATFCKYSPSCGCGQSAPMPRAFVKSW